MFLDPSRSVNTSAMPANYIRFSVGEPDAKKYLVASPVPQRLSDRCNSQLIACGLVPLLTVPF